MFSPNNGRQTKITAITAGSAQLVHTAVNDTSVGGASQFDRVSIEVCNTDSVNRTVTFLWGGTTNPDDYIVRTVPPDETIVAIDKRLINGGLQIKVFASVADKLSFYTEIG